MKKQLIAIGLALGWVACAQAGITNVNVSTPDSHNGEGLRDSMIHLNANDNLIWSLIGSSYPVTNNWATALNGSNSITLSAGFSFIGAHSGDGSALTGLSATAVTTGTLAANRIADLSATYVPVGRTITLAVGSASLTTSAGAQDLSGNRTWTLDTAQDIRTTASPSFNAPTVKQLTGTQVNLAGGSNIDWSAGTDFYDTLTGNRAFTFTNTNDTWTIFVRITGDASHNSTWPLAAKDWGPQGIPTQTPNKTDLYMFHRVAGTNYGCYIQGY